MANLFDKEAAITLTPGPVTAYPAVLKAMATPIPYNYDPYFQTLYEQVSLKAARALRSDRPTLLLHYEPAVAIEAAAASLIGSDDVVLNLVSGVYGKGFGSWAARYAKEVIEVEVGYDDAIVPEQVADALAAHPAVRIVSAVHHDTPSGTINPIREIGEVVRAHGALLIVDAVSSFAGMDIHPDDCHAGIFLTGLGKCLGGPANLTLADISAPAWDHMEANPSSPRASVLGLLDWRDAWRKDASFPFTPSIAEVHGVDAALDLYLAEGPEAVWRRHARTARACRAGVKALGLSLWPIREAIAAPTTTAIRVPDGLTSQDLIGIARARYGVMFSSGRQQTQDPVLRIGHMGPTAEPIYAVAAIAALGGALRHHGIAADVGAAVDAVISVIDAGTDEAPAP